MEKIHNGVVLGDWPVHSDEWMESRKGGLGASDIASVLNVEGAYLTPLQVWADKRGILIQEDDDREWLEWGNKLQPMIAQALAEETGYRVEETNESLVHPDYPFIRANCDSYIWDEQKGWGVGELKNVGAYNVKDWEDESPVKFQIQLQSQLFVTGLQWGVVAALIGGNKFVYHEMERNDQFIDAMLPKLKEFWRMVEENEQPLGTDKDVKLLATIHQGKEDVAVPLPAAAHEIDERIKTADAIIKQAKKDKKAAEAEMWQLLNEATLGVLPGGGGYKVITVKKEGYTVKPSSYKYLKRVK